MPPSPPPRSDAPPAAPAASPTSTPGVPGTSERTGDGRRAASAGSRESWVRRHRRALLVAAAALVVLFLMARALRPAPVVVETGEVTRGPLRVTVDEDGVTRVRDRYVVAAPVAGRLERIGLEEGDRVEAGDPVARIAAAPLDRRSVEQARASVSAAEASLAAARAREAEAAASLAQAEREAGRARRLEEAGAVSTEARERAELARANAAREREAARAATVAAAAELRTARAALVGADPGGAPAGVTVVRAPVSGRVLEVHQESESPVSPGAPLVTLGDARALEVVADVLSTDAVRVRPGMPVLIEAWGGEGALRGTVRSVSPAAFTEVSALGVEEQRVEVVADLASAPASLGDGYRVEARIVTWESPDVLRVPAGALFRRGDGWAVFAVEDGRARLREVRIGHRGEDAAEVLEGLEAGEEVIVYPSDQVEEGVRVEEE